ncbi:hypothetical protein [Geothrix oryzae]|uniref:hypothetical protein n=1 Tax=Geothrix oryzae TaxID=2927975 RepID=UPI0025747483|nr:hypothetical protein [Geothrix oryzae]
MISRFFNWLRENRQWTIDHRASFEPLQVPNSDGITGFQLLAVERLNQAGVHLDFQPKGKRGLYLQASIPGTEVDVLIYSVGAQVVGEHNYFVGEDGDFRTADELIDKLVASTIEQIRSA